MTKWHLIVRQNDFLSIDASVISRRRLTGLSVQEIENIPMVADGLSVAMSNLFDISVEDSDADSDEDQIVIEGDLSHFHALASGHDSGEFQLIGDVGNHLASGMKGGAVTVTGNAGDFACAARGASRVGMQGGSVLITGNVGDYCGHRMRRGTVVIGGNAGNFTAASMVAGTIAIGGMFGTDLGFSMKRGTILLSDGDRLVEQADQHANRFSEPARYEPSFLSLFRSDALSAITKDFDEFPVFRTRADRTTGGQGEVIFALRVPMA